MTERKLDILSSPAFVISLLILLLNDFVFKMQFHNQFTGKISDFAGLFAFSLFWAAFVPRRKTLICVSTAVLFVYWKSIYSQSLIDGWNRLPFFAIGRTVDYSDLSALLVLPLAYLYVDCCPRLPVPRRLICVIAVVSVFAFTATSYRQTLSYNDRYQFQLSKNELLARMRRLLKNGVQDSDFFEAEGFTIGFESCNADAKVIITEQDNQSVILLTEMHYRCPGKVKPEEPRQFFEKEFIERLRDTSVAVSPIVKYIWTSRRESLPSPTPSERKPSERGRR